jgi:hypothetical protein
MAKVKAKVTSSKAKTRKSNKAGLAEKLRRRVLAHKWLGLTLALVAILLIVQLAMLALVRSQKSKENLTSLTPQQARDVKRNEQLKDAVLLYIGQVVEISDDTITLTITPELNAGQPERQLKVLFDGQTSFSKLTSLGEVEENFMVQGMVASKISATDVQVGDTVLAGAREDISGTAVFYASRIQIRN